MASKLAMPTDAGGDRRTVSSLSAPHITELIEKTLDDDSAICTNTISTAREPALPAYLNELLDEKARLKQPDGNFKHTTRLINAEITRLLNGSTPDDDNNNKHDKARMVTLAEKIMVPVDKYPKYNFVGRILGPRGMTARQLEEETGCKIMVRGRGNQAKAEPLHIIIQCHDVEEIAEKKMKNAIQMVNALLHPPPEGKDELKRKQLVELSIINGTYRPTGASKNILHSENLLPLGGSISPQYLTPEARREKLLRSTPEKKTIDEIKRNNHNLLQMLSSPSRTDSSHLGMPDSSEMFRQLLDLPSLSPANCTNTLLAALSSSPPHSTANVPQGTVDHLVQAFSMLNSMPFLKNH